MITVCIYIEREREKKKINKKTTRRRTKQSNKEMTMFGGILIVEGKQCNFKVSDGIGGDDNLL
jgi:hypothetical protein